jgi:hypothetical protein
MKTTGNHSAPHVIMKRLRLLMAGLVILSVGLVIYLFVGAVYQVFRSTDHITGIRSNSAASAVQGVFNRWEETTGKRAQSQISFKT